jgi:hypothetical protein
MRGMILAAGLLTAVAAGGCFADAQVGYTANAEVAAPAPEAGPAPDMVEVSPGVTVVADYDEPVFYNDGFYWRFYNGIWYRSGSYYTGWSYYENPPVAVLRIDRPYAYSHYRPAGYVARSRPRYRAAPVREYRGPAPAYRRDTVIRGSDGGHQGPPPRREERPAPRREERPAPRREERHEEHHEERHEDRH